MPGKAAQPGYGAVNFSIRQTGALADSGGGDVVAATAAISEAKAAEQVPICRKLVLIFALGGKSRQGR